MLKKKREEPELDKEIERLLKKDSRRVRRKLKLSDEIGDAERNGY